MSRPTQKRLRACDACHSIKIKCELGSQGGSPPCERCTRLKKECTVSIPKRQKDRVAELEAEVEALRKLLISQSLNNSEGNGPNDSTAKTNSPRDGLISLAGTAASKKRRLDHVGQENSIDENHVVRNTGDQNLAFRFASLLSEDLQQRLLTKYKEQFVPVFPLVPIPQHWDLEDIRWNKPLLFEGIIYAVCHGEVPPDVKEEIVRTFIDHLAERTITTASKSLELLQTIHVSCLWFCSHEQKRSIAAFQLLELSLGMAIDVGIGGPQSTPWMGPLAEIPDNMEPAEGWRTWLNCHMLSGVMTILLRRSRPDPWTQHHMICLAMLSDLARSSPHDKLLCQYVGAELLCEQIVDDLNFVELSSMEEITTTSMQTKMQKWRNKVLDWQVQVPTNLRKPYIMVYQHVATLYANEPVLHTATNKATFAAPFIAERLSVTDFPQPPITLDHIIAVNAILTNCHALLDLFVGMDFTTMIALPGMIFASRVAYAVYVLVKLYIAVTASGNTYGTIINPEDVKVDEYIQKIVDASIKFKEMNAPPSSGWILTASVRIQEWLNSYKTMLLSNQSMGLFDHMGNIQLPTPQDLSENWDDSMMLPDGGDFDLRELFDIRE